MNAPTHEQLLNEDGLKQVSRHADDSWRHGSEVYQVFHRESDDTFWTVYYRLSTDGETNELAEGLCEIEQAWPVEETVTTYTTVQP